MKLNRLLEITTLLLNKKTVTAAELADRFGVSTRTIYRDIDVLSASGVPVYCSQGTGGGISILEDYTINRTVLSDSERDSVQFALQALQSTKYPETDTVFEKLGSIFKNSATDWISIDFSPWGSNPNANDRFTDIKAAILQSRVIEVDYINAFNEKSTRQIKPLRLIYKSQAWYLEGHCLVKQDYRLFRISRIKKVTITEKSFDRSKVRMTKPKSQDASSKRPDVHLVLKFSKDVLYRLYDDYDDDQQHDNGNDTYTLEITFPEDEWVYGYILSFGNSVEVLEPEHIRNNIAARAEKIAKKYRKPF